MPHNSPDFSSPDQWKTVDYRTVDTETLNRMLFDRIRELERAGFVDHHFTELQSLKEDSGPSFVLDLMPIFLADVHTGVNDMENTLFQPGVDFNKMYSQYIKLKGSSASFGACRIRDACSKLRHAIDNNSIEGCFNALSCIKEEYSSLREQLDSVIQLERELVSRVTGKP